MSVGFILGGVAVLALDQFSKILVVDRLPSGRLVRLVGWFGFQRVENVRGGLLPLTRGHAATLWIVAVFCALLALGASSVGTETSVGLGFALGGAAGNLADRFLRGAVIDFIAIERWPPFNLADAALVAGVVLTPAGLL